MKGQTINIYLPDGNPKGVKICGFTRTNIRAVYFPRNLFPQVKSREELLTPGVYFLFGEKDGLGKYPIYVGEAEILIQRISTHILKKMDWQYAICFTSTEGLNKAEAKYLEHLSFNELSKTKKEFVTNKETPSKASLRESDKADMDSYFEELKIIIGVLGYPIFDVVKAPDDVYVCKGKLAEAKGYPVEEGFRVMEGSKCNKEETTTLSSGFHNLRVGLIKDNILKESGDVLVFTEDYDFGSPSTAAAMVLGRNANGWTEWKKDGKTLNDIIRVESEE